MSAKNILHREINFLPQRIINKRRNTKRTILAVFIFLLCAGVLLAPVWYLRQKTDETFPVMSELAVKVKSNDELKTQLAELENQVLLKQGDNKQYGMLLENTVVMSRVLTEIDKNVPEGVWFESVSYGSGNKEKAAGAEGKTEAHDITQAIADVKAKTAEELAAAGGLAENSAGNSGAQGNTGSNAAAGQANAGIPEMAEENLPVDIKGGAREAEQVGMFINKLKGLSYIEKVTLSGIKRNETEGSYSFELQVLLKKKEGK